MLFDRLQRLVPPSQNPPDRIFQVLINQPARPILFSWPPEGFTAGEYGKLVHRMQIGGPGGDNHTRSEDGAKTSCTRRYKANQQLVDGGVLKEVESIFIPHGACCLLRHDLSATDLFFILLHRRRYLCLSQGGFISTIVFRRATGACQHSEYVSELPVPPTVVLTLPASASSTADGGAL